MSAVIDVALRTRSSADRATGVGGGHERLADEDRVVAGVAQRPRVVAVAYA